MKKHFRLFLAGLIFTSATAANSQTFSNQLNNSPFGEAGRKYGIDPYLIYSIALVESAFSSGEKGFVKPHKYAVRSSLGAEYPATKREAEKALRKHIEGTTNLRTVDVCLMQVNLGWNGHRVSTPDDLLNIDTCIDTGAAILKDTLNSTSDLYVAIGRYHTWSDPKAAQKYAAKVIRTYNNLPR